MGNGSAGIEKAAAVGKGVGRDVHHAHDEGFGQRERKSPALQYRGVSLFYAPAAGAVAPSAPASGAGGLAALCEPLGLGGRGGLPAMMSPIWSASMVSHSSRVFAISSTLSRFSSSSLLARRYCTSMMRRLSASAFCMVASEKFLWVVIERPRKISLSFSP